VFVDEAGRSGALSLSIENLSALIMTLPTLATTALRAHHSDPSLRIVYPVGHFALESVPRGQSLILSLATPDGFEVTFALRPATAAELQSAIANDAPGAIRRQ
jgi:hypothetical protein